MAQAIAFGVLVESPEQDSSRAQSGSSARHAEAGLAAPSNYSAVVSASRSGGSSEGNGSTHGPLRGRFSWSGAASGSMAGPRGVSPPLVTDAQALCHSGKERSPGPS